MKKIKPDWQCVSCKSARVPERTKCEHHLAKGVAASSRVYRQRKADGKCVYIGCEDAAQSGHTLCAAHLARLRQYAKTRRTERQAASLCVDCGNRSEFGQARCITCSSDSRKGLPRPIRNALTELHKQEAQAAKDAQARRRREFIERYLYLIPADRDRQILQMRYGYTEADSKTLAEAGRAFGISRERVRQIQVRAEKLIPLNSQIH